MNEPVEALYRLNVQLGDTRTDWYFDSASEVQKARQISLGLGLRLRADDRIGEVPEDDFVTDADEFRNGIVGQILDDRALQIAHSDPLDAMFNERVIEVRNALRAQGWDGAPYGVLSKDGASAIFTFDHAPIGRNIIGMSINGIEDRLELPAEHLATEVSDGAQEYLKRNRRVEVLMTAAGGCEGSYSVTVDSSDQIVETPINWKPDQPDSGTHEVQLRMRRYGRFDGEPFVLSGDTWRTLEDSGATGALWSNLLSGIPVEQAVQQALGAPENVQPMGNGELEVARDYAAKHGLTNIRVAGTDDKLPSVGPFVAITPAYVVQNVGMGSAVLHHLSAFENTPAISGHVDVRYEAGKAVVHKARSQTVSNDR